MAPETESDFGTGLTWQYQLAEQMFDVHQRFPFELVVLTGDNICGSDRPQDFASKCELAYKPLLDRKVKFYESLGNHDDRSQRYYRLFNMDGRLYYSFEAPAQNVRFESTYLDPEQLE